MSLELTKLLETVEITEPQQVDGLQVFGVRWASPGRLSYATLDEALAAGTLEVTEITEGGSVPVLKVVNKADAMVFLMAGEQLIGAKQNRVLNASIMVPARAELPISVSCVERGRWGYRSPRFGSGGTMSHGLLRKMVSGQATESYKAGKGAFSDQAKVWAEVTRKLDSLGTESSSAALHEAYEDYGTRLGEVLDQVRAPEGCGGVVFVLRGRIAGVDLFDQAATLVKLFPKLVRAYALDAMEVKEPDAKAAAAEEVRLWVRSAAEAKAEPFKSAGLGYDVRLEGQAVVGAGLVVEDQPVHVELFAN